MPRLESFKKIAVIDDDSEILEWMNLVLPSEGAEVRCFLTADDFLDSLQTGEARYDAVITDLQMPGKDGIALLKELATLGIQSPTFVMTAYASIETAVESIRAGAFDFITKPLKTDELIMKLQRAESFFALKTENQRLLKQVKMQELDSELIGESRSMRSVRELVLRVAGTDSTVLIQGESGTGKELVARGIHGKGARSAHPFIAVNCAAIPSELLEAELFGYEKNAFTGASQRKNGLFVEADQGTLFLDEIGDMPIELQAKLLRVIQEKAVRPIGATHYRPVNVRLLCATHRDVQQMVREGKFREDLFYRLNVIRIDITPLRERPEDVPPLVRSILRKIGGPHYRVTAEAMKILTNRRWPGNVRELQNALERAVVLSTSHVLNPAAFEFAQEDKMPAELSGDAPPLKSLSEVESEYIGFVLRHVKSHKDKAAQILGIDRKTLYRKLKTQRPPKWADKGTSP